MRSKKASVFLLLLVSNLAGAAELQNPEEIDVRYKRLDISYYVNDDLSHSETFHTVKQILQERALENAKNMSISFSSSIEKAEIIEAYTLKPDGRRINSPETNFQLRTNKGKGKHAPVFSDRTTLTVVFPEVQVGDATVFKYKIIQTEPMFPGHFTAVHSFSKNVAMDSVNVTMNVPASLKARYQIRGMTEKVAVKGGRRIYSWHLENPVPVKNKRRNYSVWDLESTPGFSYSTFSSYKEIVDAYAKRAIPKAAVTDAVRRLAKTIVGEESDKREKARLLYEWVARKITYAGNCIGVGAVVPHDISFILDNRMGDCKDHATLLQALYEAEGIRSTQALINSGSIYSLPAIPQVGAVNHVINYLPEYDLFVDATSQNEPFGSLPFSISDKPVLLLDGYQPGARTPATPIGKNALHMKTVVTIDKTGAVSGDINIHLKGAFASKVRAGFRNSTKYSEEEWLKRIFSSEGHIGRGMIVKDDPQPLIDTFHYSVNFGRKNFIQYFGAGAFHVAPFMPTYADIWSFLQLSPEVEEVPIACSSGFSTEEYEYRFPDDMKILAMPKSVDIQGAYLSYQASYTVEGNTLRVKKVFEDKTPGNVCAPELIKSQRAVIQKIVRNMKSQVVYQIKE